MAESCYRQSPSHGDQAHALDFIGRELDAREITVIADAKLPKVQLLQEELAGAHFAQFLEINLSSVRKSGRQAGTGRLVPGGQSERLTVAPDIFLRHLRFNQRMAYAPFIRSL